jgi:hypothetical protein
MARHKTYKADSSRTWRGKSTRGGGGRSGTPVRELRDEDANRTDGRTADMVELKIGDVLVDNDPRVKGRTVKIVSVTDSQAVCEPLTQHPGARNMTRKVVVSRARIFDDDKPRRSGFTVRRA